MLQLDKAIDWVIDLAKEWISKYWIYESRNERKFALEILKSREINSRLNSHHCSLKEFIICTIKNSYLVPYMDGNRANSLFKLFYSYKDIYEAMVAREPSLKLRFYLTHLWTIEMNKRVWELKALSLNQQPNG